jgi:hypothetical protein
MGESAMAARKSMLHRAPARPELDRLVEEARKAGITEEQMHEQRISFAFGNAPATAERLTKDSVRAASTRSRLLPA